MDMAQLEQDINAAWDDRDSISAATTGAVRDAVNAALGMLDNGCLLYTSPSPRDRQKSRMPSSA